MNFRIDWQRLRSDPLHLVWVIAYCLAGFFVLQIADTYLMPAFWQSPFPAFPFPYIVAAGRLIHEGLERFSGNPVLHEWTHVHTTILAAVIVNYLIIPPLFIWALAERREWRRRLPEKSNPTKIILILGLLGSSVAFILFGSVVAGPISASVYSRLTNGQTTAANKDLMINTMTLMAFRAQSFFAVPVELGGGGGRWQSLEDDPTGNVTAAALTQRDPEIKELYRGSFEITDPEWIIEVVREDSLVIWGIGTLDGDIGTFQNRNGQEGKIQVHALVTPLKLVVRRDN